MNKCPNHIALFCLILIPLFLSSCKDAPTAPTPNEIYSESSGHPLPDLSEIDNLGGLLGTFLIKQDLGSDVESAFARFGEEGLDAGDVEVNGYNLPWRIVDAALVYSSSAGTPPPVNIPNVRFDGSDHVFSVEGSIDIEAFGITVESPEDFLLQEPTLLATVKQSDGLEVVWTGGSASSEERLLISITSADNNRSTTYFSTDVPNTGSYSITAGNLEAVSGSVLLNVTKYRTASESVSGRTYVAVSEIIYSRIITITP